MIDIRIYLINMCTQSVHLFSMQLYIYTFLGNRFQFRGKRISSYISKFIIYKRKPNGAFSLLLAHCVAICADIPKDVLLSNVNIVHTYSYFIHITGI